MLIPVRLPIEIYIQRLLHISAYAYHQGASQAMIGGFMSLSAMNGLPAAATYPKLRGCVGG